MRGALVLILCRCAFALNPSLDISQYAHNKWTARDGFFKGSISSIAQTPDGYLWLGTDFGLVRFDGVRSVPWSPPDGEHLPGTLINGLLSARDGRLWIATNQGLVSWKDGKLTHYPQLAGHYIFALLEDRDGTIWISGWAGSGRIWAIHSGSTRCNEENGSFGSGMEALYEDRSGNLWAGGLASVWRLRPGPPQLYRMPDPELTVHGLIEGDDGALWIALRSGIMELVNGKAGKYPLPDGGQQVTPRQFLRDRDGGLWIGTADSGLWHVHQGRADRFTQSDGLSGDAVQRLAEDREGNIWVATADGLDRFRDFAIPTISVKQGLSKSWVGSVLASRDGSVWLGTTSGLNRWRDGRITIYRKESGLPDDYIESLFQDEGGRIWVSTLRGLSFFENGRFTPISGVPGRYGHSIAGDSAGNLWISHDLGLFHLHAGRLVERIPWARLGGKGRDTTLLAEPGQGGLWLAFTEGGIAYFQEGEIRATYSHANGLGEGPVNDLHLDQDGTLWAATAGGLSRVKNGRAATLASQNGLPCDTIHALAEGDAHSLWLYTACGLVRIARSELDAWAKDEKRTIQVAVFDNSDGVGSHALPISSFSPRFAKAVDGKLWFAHADGVSVFDPRHVPVNKLAPPVHIEEVKADGKSYAPTRGLRLPARVRDVWIDYTALSFAAPEKVRFRYRLEGQDTEWKELVNEREAKYSNLAPRRYRFRVIACNNSGVWNETGDTLDFSVDPAYFQTAWFEAACVAALLVLLWALYRYRLHQIARRLDIRAEERTRIARDLHDTLLQSFQGLMLGFQMVDNQLPLGKAKDLLEKTLERADQAIAEGRDAVHDLRSSTTVTNDLADAVRALGDELASADSGAFEIVVEGAPRDLHPILRDEIYRLAREAVRNAFRHAQASRIEVEISYGEKLFRLRIRDDGGGIPPEILDEGRAGHYGLPGMRERAREIGGQLNVWSGKGTGTEIEFDIPGSIAYGTSPARKGWRRFGRFLSFLALLVIAGCASAADAGVHLIRLPVVEGEDIRFTQLRSGQGLLEGEVNHIVQDDQGFMWFGTSDGLRRYDGYAFKEYRHNPQDPNSLSGATISALFKDRSGKLWVGSDAFLDMFDPANDKFTHFSGAGTAGIEGVVHDISQDRKGMLWIASYQGLYRLDPTTGQTARLPARPWTISSSLSSNQLKSTFEEKDGTFWVATAEGLDIFDRSREK